MKTCKRILLIGNGINRIFEGQTVTQRVENSFVSVTTPKTPSWNDMLAIVSAKFGIPHSTNDHIPAPVVFENIVNSKSGDRKHDARIRKLKETIASVIGNSALQANDYHRKIMEMPEYDDILTTNYDYCLEKSVIPDFMNQRASLAVNKDEYAYSLKRRYQIADKRVWHIHGELYNSKKVTGSHYYSESILIGFEQYCLYLENIIKNIKDKRPVPQHNHQKNWTYLSLAQRMEDSGYNLKDSPFWVDRFFTSDVDIIGFSFDFSETHLWWLLSHRVRLMDEGRVGNKIRYFYPDMDDTLDQTTKAAGIRYMLNSLNVECVPVRCKDYEDFYAKFVEGSY